MPTQYLTITWDQLHRDARALAALLIGHGPLDGAFRGIVAVSRGGLVPAAIVARELECRLVECVSVVTYQEQAIGTPVLLKPPAAAGDGAGFVVIDDLIDTGTTLRLLRSALPRAHFACLYAKPAARSEIDTAVLDIPQDHWVLFPWDTAPQFVAPLVAPKA